MRAARHAWAIQRDLTHFIVINFPVRDGDELAPQRDFRKIRTKARSWLYHRRSHRIVDPLTDVRTWESASGVEHVNWLIHIPHGLTGEFLAMLPVWIGKVFGSLPEGAYHVEEIYNLNGVLKYILKGTQQGHAHRFGINPVYQGEVWGRRAVASTCLGKTARERDEFDGQVVRTSRFRKQKTPA